MHKISKKNFLFIALLTLINTNIYTQTMIGLNHSNLSGIHQANFNPANLAGLRHRLYVNPFTMNSGFYNNYLSLDLPFPIYQITNPPSQFQNSNGNLKFDPNWVKENLDGKGKDFNLYSELRTPGIAIKLSQKLSIGLQVKNNINFSINNFAEPMARLAFNGVDSIKGVTLYSGNTTYKIGDSFKDNTFAININSYGAIGGTIAYSLINKEKLTIKIGATPKLLIGYASGYIKNNGFEVKVQSKDSIIFNQTDIQYGYTNPNDFENFNPRGFFANKIKTAGFGYDFGVAFEYNPEITQAVTSNKNKYLFRGGISLLDGGNLNYGNNMKNVRIFKDNTPKVLSIDSNFARAFARGEADGIKYTDSLLRTIFTIDSSNVSQNIGMPTTLNFQFDYNVFKWFYVGLNWSQSLRKQSSINIQRPSYVVVIPRFESKFFDVSIPMGILNYYSVAQIGAFVRVGPVFVGSDNLLGQLRSNNIKGADIYFGISTNIPSKKKKNSN